MQQHISLSNQSKAFCVMSGTYIDCDVEHNDKYPKLKIGDQVRISKYKHMK